jgi:N-methylhydantoinase A
MPSVAVHTVGAGGGSIAWVDSGGALRVGPQSAGARPGPACYDRGGTNPTVTDADLVLGRINREAVLAGTVPLHAGLAESAIADLGAKLERSALETAQGVAMVVESHMAQAIRAVSVEQGADPRDATLVAFGGAGGVHATAVARALEVRRVVIPPFTGVFSALGLLLSPQRVDSARTVQIGASEAEVLPKVAGDLAEEARARYVDDTGRQPEGVSIVVDMRYAGQSHETPVAYQRSDGWDALSDRFHATHARRNGFARRADPVEVVTIRVEATGVPALTWDDIPEPTPSGESNRGTRTVYTESGVTEAALVWRPSVASGGEIVGPAIIEDVDSTTFIGPGERAVVGDVGALEITW